MFWVLDPARGSKAPISVPSPSLSQSTPSFPLRSYTNLRGVTLLEIQEEMMRGKPEYEHLDEPLHIFVEDELPVDIIDARLMQARWILEDLLKPVVRAMECHRRLLRRSSEALFLLQLISHHHTTRLVQGLDSTLRQKLVQLTFNQLVCSDEGDQLAARLISGFMEYYLGPEGRVTVDEISAKLREGCPSYFNESNYKYFLEVECLKRASVVNSAEERESLARDAFNHLTKVLESVDVAAVCKRFEDIQLVLFYCLNNV